MAILEVIPRLLQHTFQLYLILSESMALLEVIPRLLLHTTRQSSAGSAHPHPTTTWRPARPLRRRLRQAATAGRRPQTGARASVRSPAAIPPVGAGHMAGPPSPPRDSGEAALGGPAGQPTRGSIPQPLRSVGARGPARRGCAARAV